MSTTIEALKGVRWPVAVGHGVLALVRPVLNIFGVMDDVMPVGPVVVTGLITAVSVAAVCSRGTRTRSARCARRAH